MQDATRVSRMTSRWVGDEAEAAVANDVDVHLTPEDVRRRCWRRPWRHVVAAIVSILCWLPFIAEDESKSRLGVPFIVSTGNLCVMVGFFGSVRADLC